MLVFFVYFLYLYKTTHKIKKNTSPLIISETKIFDLEEQQIKHCLKYRNVIAEILNRRDEEYTTNKSITYIIINLSASEIEKHYGNQLRSRMRKIFNLISFDSNSIDNR